MCVTINRVWFPVHIWLMAGLIVTLIWGENGSAHEIRPALLDISERDNSWFDVTWKVPTCDNRVLAITPILPDSFELLGAPFVQDVSDARVERATYKSN